MKTNENFAKSNPHNFTDNTMDTFTDKDRLFSSGEGKGVQMKKWKPFSDFVLKNLVGKTEIINSLVRYCPNRPLVDFIPGHHIYLKTNYRDFFGIKLAVTSLSGKYHQAGE